MRIYIAGPYGKWRELPLRELEENVFEAEWAARWVFLRGHTPFVPHLYHYIDVLIGGNNEDRWAEIGREWLRLCDAILMIGDWQHSQGALRELDIALDMGLKVFYSIEEIR